MDVTIGAYDGTEGCRLIGILILSLLIKYVNKNHIGLYRDEGIFLKNNSGPEAEKLKENIQKSFKEKI